MPLGIGIAFPDVRKALRFERLENAEFLPIFKIVHCLQHHHVRFQIAVVQLFVHLYVVVFRQIDDNFNINARKSFFELGIQRVLLVGGIAAGPYQERFLTVFLFLFCRCIKGIQFCCFVLITHYTTI